MAKPERTVNGRIFVIAGVSDIVIGAGLVVAAFTGLLGPGMGVMAIAGGVMALVGVGFIVFGRNKLSQAESRRGDLN